MSGSLFSCVVSLSTTHKKHNSTDPHSHKLPAYHGDNPERAVPGRMRNTHWLRGVSDRPQLERWLPDVGDGLTASARHRQTPDKARKPSDSLGKDSNQTTMEHPEQKNTYFGFVLRGQWLLSNRRMVPFIPSSGPGPGTIHYIT